MIELPVLICRDIVRFKGQYVATIRGSRDWVEVAFDTLDEVAEWLRAYEQGTTDIRAGYHGVP